jgi:pimeloyl-ACP methyl ester carboxylesterase
MQHPRVGYFIARDGVEIATLSWGPSAGSPLVVLVHATGFCKEVCIPIVDDLAEMRDGLRAVAIDQRAHGDSGNPLPPYDWWDVGGDVAEVAAADSAVIGVGHSAGGAALLLAELMRPGTFASLLLVEPIVFPPPYGRFPDNPMSAMARRRRDRFPSREEAFANWRSKPAFAGWEERALWAYVDGGLRRTGDELTLKCPRDAEAEFFIAATEHRAWDRLGEIRPKVTVVAGEHSTTHQEAFLQQLTGRMVHATYEIVPGAGHMVWMERPGLIAKRAAQLLDELR